MRERVHEEGGAVEHGHEGHSAAGAVVRGGGELGSGRGRRRSGGRSGWGGGSVDRGRWGGEDKRHASVGTDHCRLERLDEENAAMVSVVAGTAREALGNVEIGKEAAQVLASIARADAEQSGENDRKEGTTERYAAGQVFFVLSGGARGEVECVGRAGSGNDVGRHEGA